MLYIKTEQPDAVKRKQRLDFLDILLTAKDDNGEGLTKQEIQDEVDTFTFEGTLKTKYDLIKEVESHKMIRHILFDNRYFRKCGFMLEERC